MLGFRAAGALGVATFATRVASALAAAVFLFTGLAHFTSARHGMARMVPAAFRNALAMVYVPGVCEIAGAIGLLLPRTRMAAGLGLIVLLIAMFPANVKAARENVMAAGRRATALRRRAPIRFGLIARLWWASRY